MNSCVSRIVFYRIAILATLTRPHPLLCEDIPQCPSFVPLEAFLALPFLLHLLNLVDRRYFLLIKGYSGSPDSRTPEETERKAGPA